MPDTDPLRLQLPFLIVYSLPPTSPDRSTYFHPFVLLSSLRHAELRVGSYTHATAFTNDMQHGKSESDRKSEPVEAHKSATRVRIRLRSCVTYHAKAPNAAAAFAALHTCPKHTLLPSQTARARKPANQNTIVKPSTPVMTPA